MCVGARQKQFAALSLEAAAAPGRHFPRPARGSVFPLPPHGGAGAAAEGLRSPGVQGSPALVSVRRFRYPNYSCRSQRGLCVYIKHLSLL